MDGGVPAVIVDDVPSDLPTFEWAVESLMRKEGCALFLFYVLLFLLDRIWNDEPRSCHHESDPVGEIQLHCRSIQRLPAAKSSATADLEA